MTKRKIEIIKNTIILFNERGVSNVKLSDITELLNISLGNLTYYFKTKKGLVEAVLNYLIEEKQKLINKSETLLIEENWLGLIRGYLYFQIDYCFFYRDILDLNMINNNAKKLYEREIKNVILFNRSAIERSKLRGYLKEEPIKGLYDDLAEILLSLYQAWFIKRAIFGEEIVSVNEPFKQILQLFNPYSTELGINAIKRLENYGLKEMESFTV